MFCHTALIQEFQSHKYEVIWGYPTAHWYIFQFLYSSSHCVFILGSFFDISSSSLIFSYAMSNMPLILFIKFFISDIVVSIAGSLIWEFLDLTCLYSAFWTYGIQLQLSKCLYLPILTSVSCGSVLIDFSFHDRYFPMFLHVYNLLLDVRHYEFYFFGC